MFFRRTLIFVLVIFASGTVFAGEGLVKKPSAHSVDDTVARIQEALKAKGIRVFAVVDHTQNAKGVDLELAEEQVVIFGNPRLGTPLMLSNPTVGIDLPMKMLVWKDKNGKVWVAYNDPQYLAKRHGITDRDEVITKMTGALGKISDKATAP